MEREEKEGRRVTSYRRKIKGRKRRESRKKIRNRREERKVTEKIEKNG